MIPSNIFQSFGASPRLTPRTLVSNVPNSQNAYCALRYTSKGILQITQGGGGGVVTTVFPEWWGQNYQGAVNVGNGFDIRLQVFSGSAPNLGSSSSVNVWLPLNGADRLWELFVNSPGQTLNAVWVVDIRNSITLQNLANTGYTITCTKNA